MVCFHLSPSAMKNQVGIRNIYPRRIIIQKLNNVNMYLALLIDKPVRYPQTNF